MLWPLQIYQQAFVLQAIMVLLFKRLSSKSKAPTRSYGGGLHPKKPIYYSFTKRLMLLPAFTKYTPCA